MTGFPTAAQGVQVFPAPGVEGDFASANPRFSVLASQGALVSGSSLIVGRMAWVDPTGVTANSFGSGPVAGFVGRNWQGLITTFLAETSMQVLPGIMCSLYSGGDFWAKNAGTNSVVPGMKAYALYASGALVFAATGNPPQAATSTASTIAAGTSTSVTASIAAVNNPGNVEIGIMTVTAVGSGALVVGGLLSGTGVQSGTQIVNQLTGTAGGVGTYTVNIPQTTASTTVTQSYGLFTAGGTITGTFGVGDVLSGSGVTAGTTITALGTGTGGAGTYIVQTSQTAASTAINATAGIETKWIAMSQALPGELVKISDHPLG